MNHSCAIRRNFWYYSDSRRSSLNFSLAGESAHLITEKVPIYVAIFRWTWKQNSIDWEIEHIYFLYFKYASVYLIFDIWSEDWMKLATKHIFLRKKNYFFSCISEVTFNFSYALWIFARMYWYSIAELKDELTEHMFLKISIKNQIFNRNFIKNN